MDEEVGLIAYQGGNTPSSVSVVQIHRKSEGEGSAVAFISRRIPIKFHFLVFYLWGQKIMSTRYQNTYARFPLPSYLPANILKNTVLLNTCACLCVSVRVRVCL